MTFEPIKCFALMRSALIMPALAVAFAVASTVYAAVPCDDDNLCQEMLFNGSQCIDGHCTNPWRGGCLGPLLASEEYAQKYTAGGEIDSKTLETIRQLRRRLASTPRVCNSEDGPDAASRGICAENANDYPEVRIWAQNWESAFSIAWLMQIILSELLGVPSTIETGDPEKHLNFYDEANRMDYGKANEYEMFRRAHEAEGGDCSVYRSANAGATAEDYIPCAHVNMDVWFPNNDLRQSQKLGYASSLQYVGLIGFQGWHISRISLSRDSSLATHFGLVGNENRQKLAERFKRPTTWKDYCTVVSVSNCTVPDDVALRPPVDDGSEDGRYFFSGSYTGYFRATNKNNCTKTEKCTGHFVDYPCGWTSYFKQQARHLEIALESDGSAVSGGYTYGEITDIWLAANATRSDVIGIWWTPDYLPKILMDYGSEPTAVMLPAATTECIENRIDVTKRCDANATEFDIYGSEEGSCGESSLFTQKVAVSNMEASVERSTRSAKARMSPAYGAYRDFSITALQIDEILLSWIRRDRDKFGFDLRHATCGWLADNLDQIVQSIIPEDHPRAFVQVSGADALTIVALVFGAISSAAVIGTTARILYLNGRKKLRRGAQIEFLLLLLAGLLFVSIGSILMALDPSDGTCVGAIWMINIGYTSQLAPTLIRVHTIIGIVQASRRMRIVHVDKKKLLGRSVGLCVLAAVFCTLWTRLSPPQSIESLDVTQSKNDLGETIVSVSHYCDSSSKVWFAIMFVSQGILLLCASVLAFQMRSVPNAVNDSKSLAVMIYSSLIFLVLRLTAYAVAGTLPIEALAKSYLQKARSLFCSLDTAASLVIFFPKFLVPKKGRESLVGRGLAVSGLADRRSSPGQVSRMLGGSDGVAAPVDESSIGFIRLARKDISVVGEEHEEEIDLPGWVLERYGRKVILERTTTQETKDEDEKAT